MVPQGAKTHGHKLAGLRGQHALSRSPGGEGSDVPLAQGRAPCESWAGGQSLACSSFPWPPAGSVRGSSAALQPPPLPRRALSPSCVPVRHVSFRKDTGRLSPGSSDKVPQVGGLHTAGTRFSRPGGRTPACSGPGERPPAGRRWRLLVWREGHGALRPLLTRAPPSWPAHLPTPQGIRASITHLGGHDLQPVTRWTEGPPRSGLPGFPRQGLSPLRSRSQGLVDMEFRGTLLSPVPMAGRGLWGPGGGWGCCCRGGMRWPWAPPPASRGSWFVGGCGIEGAGSATREMRV